MSNTKFYKAPRLGLKYKNPKLETDKASSLGIHSYFSELIFKGHVIFCNGYLSDPLKNPGSYFNVILDKNPDDPSQNPIRGRNMSEKSLTDKRDVLTNKELELIDRQGGDFLYSDKIFEKSEYFRWLFSAKNQFEGYWDGYSNISNKRFSKVFGEYFNAKGNAHFINGSHGLQSSGAHRVDHGISQGYAWAKSNWEIKKFSEVQEDKRKLAYTPAYQPITIVGHSQGAAIAAGVAIGVLYYAFEQGWKEIPINLLFLGTHQPQGLYGSDYEDFVNYYYEEDYVNDWILEWVSDIFSKEKLKQKEGIYERMNNYLGNSWGGLMKRAVQFTFPNDRALFVTRMGDIPGVKNACNKTDVLDIAGWYFGEHYPSNDPNFTKEKDGYLFPTRLLNKAFNTDGSIIKDGHTYKDVVRMYWNAFNEYRAYKEKVQNNPDLKYGKATEPLPDINFLPTWFTFLLRQSIEKVEEEKARLYLESELYRKKLNALLLFAKVHEMELQAHFAPVGLMFNQGTLSDWEEHQDQTIWDRIQAAGKGVFYRLDSASVHSEPSNPYKTFADTKGKERMISTAIVNNTRIRKWIDKAKDEMKEEKDWLADIKKWWYGDKYYGSGWAHGARQELLKALGFKDGKIDNLIEASIYSVLQAGEVIIDDESKLKEILNSDPELQVLEREIAQRTIKDKRYLKKDFQYSDSKSVQFGGKRAQGEMWEQFVNPLSPKYKDTWKVAINELTWLVRSVFIKYTVEVKKDGSVSIIYAFEDTFDLRPGQGRNLEYNTITMIAGFLYHDLIGGNDLMKVKADWSNEYTKEEIELKSK